MQRSACVYICGFIYQFHAKWREAHVATSPTRALLFHPDAAAVRFTTPFKFWNRSTTRNTVWLGTTEPPAASVNGRRVERVAASAGDRAANLQEFQ